MRITAALTSGLLVASAALFALTPAAFAADQPVGKITRQQCQQGGGRVFYDRIFHKPYCEGGTHHLRPVKE
ncbi:hypothetical protein ACWCSD_50275 [Nonomuraea sp. NPDC001684]